MPMSLDPQAAPTDPSMMISLLAISCASLMPSSGLGNRESVKLQEADDSSKG